MIVHRVVNAENGIDCRVGAVVHAHPAGIRTSATRAPGRPGPARAARAVAAYAPRTRASRIPQWLQRGHGAGQYRRQAGLVSCFTQGIGQGHKTMCLSDVVADFFGAQVGHRLQLLSVATASMVLKRTAAASRKSCGSCTRRFLAAASGTAFGNGAPPNSLAVASARWSVRPSIQVLGLPSSTVGLHSAGLTIDCNSCRALRSASPTGRCLAAR